MERKKDDFKTYEFYIFLDDNSTVQIEQNQINEIKQFIHSRRCIMIMIIIVIIWFDSQTFLFEHICTMQYNNYINQAETQASRQKDICPLDGLTVEKNE